MVFNPLVMTHIANWKITIFNGTNDTISTGSFSIATFVYQRVTLGMSNICLNIFKMRFGWKKGSHQASAIS